MEISGEQYRLSPPLAAPEEGEFIDVFRVPVSGLAKFVAAEESSGVGIDSKIYTMLTTLNWLQ